MDVAVTEYQYMIWGDAPDNVEERGGLFRLRDGDPLLLAEFVTADGNWKRSDSLYRYRMMGTTDYDFTETTVERADQILDAWVARGRISKKPHPEQDDRPDDETIEKFQALEDQMKAVWSSVPVPEGVENVGS